MPYSYHFICSECQKEFFSTNPTACICSSCKLQKDFQDKIDSTISFDDSFLEEQYENLTHLEED